MKFIICIIASLLIASILLSVAFDTVSKNLAYVDVENESETNQTEKSTSKQTNKATQSKPKNTAQSNNTENNTSGTSTNKATEAPTISETSESHYIYSNYELDISKAPNALRGINNGVLNQAYAGTITLHDNIRYLKSHTASAAKNTVKAPIAAALYILDGEIKNWVCEKDILYAITSYTNNLIAIDSQNMLPIYKVTLPAPPAEINIIDYKIYISFPALKQIGVYSMASGKQESMIALANEGHSFCIDENYIFYTESSQHCDIYRMNLQTEETELVRQFSNSYTTFYYPKIYLNKEDRLLYIGETSSSGCDLFYVDADTLEFKGTFSKDGYGVHNSSRQLFHFDNKVVWGNYCFSDTNINQIYCVYGDPENVCTYYATKDYVVTREGIFNTNTAECIMKYTFSDDHYKDAIITESYNIFFKRDTSNRKAILGVNMNFQ